MGNRRSSGRRRSSQDELFKIRSRLVLAAFVFNPQGAGSKPGFQGRDVAVTAIRVFKKYFGGYSNQRSGLLRVTAVCRTLVHQGLLVNSKRVQASFLMPARGTKSGHEEVTKYMSPTFNLSEAGLMRVLSECDPEFLIRIQPQWLMQRSMTYKSQLCGYDLDDHNSQEMFLRFVGISEEEYAKGIYIG